MIPIGYGINIESFRCDFFRKKLTKFAFKCQIRFSGIFILGNVVLLKKFTRATNM